METLKAPFPWFGGKSRVARQVWARFGNVRNYVEPFAGSLAVLLGRPHEARVETVNDKDKFIGNFWRALQSNPEKVAYYADWPVNEGDLHARHHWLVYEGIKRLENGLKNPDFYDAKIAGWWVYGQCLWIGSGWCAEPGWRGKANTANQKRRFNSNERGVVLIGGLTQPWKKKPATNARGDSNGIHRVGLHRWQGGGAGGGSGIHAPSLSLQKPVLSGDAGAVGRGIHSARMHRTEGIYEYLESLAHRLRRVRVCVGDWERVVTESLTTYIGTTGVFLDPPYDQDLRSICYSLDENISAKVREWALANGDHPDFRIALCGYAGEHQMPSTWEEVPWRAHGGYSRSERGKANRGRERVWFSPHCLKPGDKLPFGEAHHQPEETVLCSTD